ncbi:hypothetical protein IWX84_002253 [Flavobacterium sp. CG_9.10]|nr:hypothetical protein [Flavobacterium sp. CG_9.10]
MIFILISPYFLNYNQKQMVFNTSTFFNTTMEAARNRLFTRKIHEAITNIWYKVFK